MPDRPSTFEVITALAMTYFARQHADAAVLEVGLGGRLDATNVVTPRVSVITSISYDHMAVLGNTLTEIATEKAGIIKPGVPVVSSPQTPEAQVVIERVCQERGAPLTLVGRDVDMTILSASRAGVHTRVSGPGYSYDLHIPLMGEHQAANAATAVAALHVLRSQGVAISDEHITSGLSHVQWPGRLEIVARQPFIIVDGAHNLDSAQKLRAALDKFFPRRGSGGCRPRVLVLGMSTDKDIANIMAELVPNADAVIVTCANHPRAASLERLQAAAAPYGSNVFAIASVAGALAKALQLAGDNGLICASGSLFIVADVRALVLGLRNEELPGA
jgi:dihydrofolate synthase/folylpolyglutamate synthase